MRYIRNISDDQNKYGDTDEVFRFNLLQGDDIFNFGDYPISVNIANSSGYILSMTPEKEFGNSVIKLDFNNDLLKSLPPDGYLLEVEVTLTDGTVSKFPTKGGMPFTINKDLKGVQGTLVPTVTFDAVLESVDEKIAVYMDTVKVGPKGDTGSSALPVAGVYPTLSALIAATPDNTKVYITADNGNWNYWNGTTWVAGGVYQATAIADRSVTTSKLADSSVIPSKTNFISKNPKNINLFDKKSENNWFGKVVNTTGNIQTLSDWNYSHSIPCKPGDTFIVGTTSATSNGYAGLFNGEQWVSNVTNTNGYWKVPTDFSGTSIRFAISASMFESTMIVLMPNVLPKTYIPFNFLLDVKIKLDYANLENVNVGENDVNFLRKNQGSNKFDLNNTQPRIINKDKVNTTLAGYVSTNDIPVKTGDIVNWNFGGYGWVLDSQKNPIEYMPNPDLYKNSYTISSVNASFVRIAIPTSDVSKGMVTINEPIPTIYQPFRSFYELADNIKINESNVIKSQTNETKNPISGKTVSIIGDSYSAFAGWIPEGNSISYDGTYNGVTSVSDMWWFKVIQKFNMSLMLNESWAGSTICNTGYGVSDATTTSFLTRITKRYGATNTLGQKPQVLFVLGGLNDTWANSPLGNVKYSDWTTDDLKTVLGAYSKMINDILLYNPGIEIINFEYAAVSQAIRDGKALICEHFGVKNVPISAVDSSAGHPTTTGMQQIVDQIITALNV